VVVTGETAAPAVRTPPLTDRGRRTQLRLLEAGRRVFEAKGWAATRMGDIAEAADVSHGTVYTWFPTKDALLRTLVTAMRDDLLGSLRDPEAADPAARIEAANRRYLDVYREHARLLQVVEEAAPADPFFGSVLADLRTTHVGRVADAIRRLQAADSAYPELDAHTSAAALCAMVEGFARHWHGRGEEHDADLATATLTHIWTRALGLRETVRVDVGQGKG
jgi:AcrR family transcriptional regulator